MRMNGSPSFGVEPKRIESMAKESAIPVDLKAIEARPVPVLSC